MQNNRPVIVSTGETVQQGTPEASVSEGKSVREVLEVSNEGGNPRIVQARQGSANQDSPNHEQSKVAKGGDELFSPRSTAALALSCISQIIQQPSSGGTDTSTQRLNEDENESDHPSRRASLNGTASDLFGASRQSPSTSRTAPIDSKESNKTGVVPTPSPQNGTERRINIESTPSPPITVRIENTINSESNVTSPCPNSDGKTTDVPNAPASAINKVSPTSTSNASTKTGFPSPHDGEHTNIDFASRQQQQPIFGQPLFPGMVPQPFATPMGFMGHAVVPFAQPYMMSQPPPGTPHQLPMSGHHNPHFMETYGAVPSPYFSSWRPFPQPLPPAPQFMPGGVHPFPPPQFYPPPGAVWQTPFRSNQPPHAGPHAYNQLHQQFGTPCFPSTEPRNGNNSSDEKDNNINNGNDQNQASTETTFNSATSNSQLEESTKSKVRPDDVTSGMAVTPTPNKRTKMESYPMQPMPMNHIPVCGVVPGAMYYAVYDDAFLNRGDTTGLYSRVTTPMKPMNLSQSSSSKQSSKKQDYGDEKYNRKNKSLGVLATAFLSRFDLTFKKNGISENYDLANRRNYMNRPEVVIDQLANELSVERRRIYDVVNILEALQLVMKKAKNTYVWMGMDHMTQQFAILQSEAIERWPEQARRNDLIITKHSKQNDKKSGSTTNSDKSSLANEDRRDCTSKSLTRLSQMFLHVFLVGFEDVTLPIASELIHGSSQTPEDLAVLGYANGSRYKKALLSELCQEDKGLKTKIRRLYDIANVFVSVGLLSKKEDKGTANPLARRPHYSWGFYYSIQDIHEFYHKIKLETKLVGSPIGSGDEDDSDSTQLVTGKKGTMKLSKALNTVKNKAPITKATNDNKIEEKGTRAPSSASKEAEQHTITPPTSSGSHAANSAKSSSTSTKKRISKKSKDKSQYL